MKSQKRRSPERFSVKAMRLIEFFRSHHGPFRFEEIKNASQATHHDTYDLINMFVANGFLEKSKNGRTPLYKWRNINFDFTEKSLHEMQVNADYENYESDNHLEKENLAEIKRKRLEIQSVNKYLEAFVSAGVSNFAVPAVCEINALSNYKKLLDGKNAKKGKADKVVGQDAG